MRRPCCALLFLRAGVRFLFWFHFAPTWVLIFISALLIRGPCLVTRRIGAVSWLISSVANVRFCPLCLLWVTSVFLLIRGFWWYCIVMAAEGASTATDCPPGGEPQDFVYWHRPAEPLDRVISYIQSPSGVQARRYVYVVSKWLLLKLLIT